MLKEGEVAIVGYGSLISKSSMEETLLRLYKGVYKQVQIKGWKRAWDISHPNMVDYIRYFYNDLGEKVFPKSILYLNIIKSPESVMNACLFVIKEEELAFFDEREKVYNRIDISAYLLHHPFPKQPVWVYVGKEEFVKREVQSTSEAIVRQTYLEIVSKGLDDMGREFQQEYLASTQPYPKHLVVEDFLE